MAKNRYPGTQPFTAEQKDLFYGRKQETEDLMKLIRFQQMVVLYGKSGLGKSSLLNTKIKQDVETHKIAEVFAVRFNAWTDGEETPLSKTVAALLPDAPTALSAIADNTLWYAAKSRQIVQQRQRFLLVFDQFEELFTYPDEAIQAFKESLAELMRAGLPKRIEESIKSLALSDDDLDTLYETADIKVLFAIRSDRMHLLDKLSDVLPDILRHCYELKALVEADAREAIVQPAAMEGDFDTLPFSYTEGALADILSFLKDEDGRIEAIQLQTLCQAFERTIHTEGVSITAADTPTEKLKDIIDHYYKTQIDDPRIDDKHTAHRLIEDELVIETGDNKGVRVTLHELSILVKFAQRSANEADEKIRLKHLLDALVNVHLLRREVGSRGGDTYELSHDRLIEPVLKSKKVYVTEKLQREAAAEQARKETELAEAKRQAAIEKRKSQRAILLSIASIIGLLVAVWFYFKADKATKEANDNFAKAQTAELKTRAALDTAEMRRIQADSLGKVAITEAENAKSNFELAQKRAAEAKLNADAATTARQEAEKNLTLANEQKGIATEALEQAKTNLQKAQNAEAKALSEQTKTQKALDDAKAANERVVKSYLRDIEQHILKLEYEVATEKCQTALALNIENQKAAIAQYVFEIAYWYTETDTVEAAVNTLKLLNINALPNRLALRKAIETNAPPQYFSVLEARYYPKMIAVEGDSFTMGYDPDTSYQNTPHPVTVSSFKIAQTETTVWQYFLYLKAHHQNPRGTPSWQYWGDNPMIYVSWYDAVDYCNWVSEKHGLQKVYNLTNQKGEKDYPDYDVTIDYTKKGYRLPTEAEWEFAARGGKFHEGFGYSGDSILNKVAWYYENSNNRTQPVATKNSNKLGLFDMSGNVWEWCNDWYAPYDTLKTNNPRGAEKESRRLLRGGSWYYLESHSRLALRYDDYPRYWVNDVGFRVLQDK